MTATVRAPRDRVFDAWLSADRLGRFLCAGDTHVASVESEATAAPGHARPAIQKDVYFANLYSWPGNIRELENVVKRALVLDKDG